MTASSPTTLRTVATATGLSMATVSRALRGQRGVAPGTMATVIAAAKRLAYRPDLGLSALSQYRWPERAGRSTGVLAHLVDQANTLHPEFIAAIRERAESIGYQIERIEIAPGEDAPTLSRRLSARRICGVLINIHDDRILVAATPCLDEVAGVVLGEGQRHLSLPRVSTDWTWVVEDATRRLLQAGHRRIGYVLRRFAGADLTDELRAAALYCRCADEQSLEIPLFLAPGQIRSGHAPLRRWLAEHRPTAIVADGPTTASALESCGARPGRDLAFVAIIGGGDPVGGRRISGHVLDLAARARQGLDLLHLSLLHGERGPRLNPPRVLLPSTWVEGNSLIGAPR